MGWKERKDELERKYTDAAMSVANDMSYKELATYLSEIHLHYVDKNNISSKLHEAVRNEAVRRLMAMHEIAEEAKEEEASEEDAESEYRVSNIPLSI